MNPLTSVKRLQKINERETDLGVSEDASWHAKYKGSAYIFVGGLPFDLTEGDLLAVFAQYGEIVDVNLVRDKGTGKSRGFAFIAYEDQRSTTLAVDNLNGTQILGRVIRVDHVERYKKLEEEDEETVRKKREERGVCRAFQRGECTRGDACKFSHDEQRAANTGWGAEDQGLKWGHDKYEGSKQNDRRFGSRSGDKDSASRLRVNEKTVDKIDGGERNSSKRYEDIEPKSRRDSDRKEEKRSSRHGADKFEPKQRQELYRSERNRDFEQKSGEDMRGDERWKRQSDDGKLNQSIDYDKREEKRSRRHESESYQRDDRDRREGRRSEHDRDSSSHRHGDRNDHRHKSDR